MKWQGVNLGKDRDKNIERRNVSFETRLYSLLFCSTLLHSLIAHALGLRFLSFLISWIRHDTDHFISASFNSRLNTFKDQRQNFFLKTHKRSQLHYNPPPPKKKDKKLTDKVFTEFIFFLINHDLIFELIQCQSDFIKLTLQNKMWKSPAKLNDTNFLIQY